MRLFLLLSLFIVGNTLFGQQSKGPVYFGPPVNTSDSTMLDSIWKLFNLALKNRDVNKIKSMSLESIYLMNFKSEQTDSMLKIGSINALVDSLLEVIKDAGFFEVLDKSYTTFNSLATYESNKSKDDSYPDLNPVIFNISITRFPLGIDHNSGWNFVFQKTSGNMKFSGLLEF